MALAAELERLERRRHQLVHRNDELREEFAARCTQVTSPSYWMQHGMAMAQKALTSRTLISTAFSLFQKFRK